MQQISYEELKKWQAQHVAFMLVDVRTIEEHHAYNIGGCNLPLGRSLIQASSIFPLDQPIVFYCRKGVRSQIAIQRVLMKRAALNCYNLEGGISAFFE